MPHGRKHTVYTGRACSVSWQVPLSSAPLGSPQCLSLKPLLLVLVYAQWHMAWLSGKSVHIHGPGRTDPMGTHLVGVPLVTAHSGSIQHYIVAHFMDLSWLVYWCSVGIGLLFLVSPF